MDSSPPGTVAVEARDAGPPSGSRGDGPVGPQGESLLSRLGGHLYGADGFALDADSLGHVATSRSPELHALLREAAHHPDATVRVRAEALLGLRPDDSTTAAQDAPYGGGGAGSRREPPPPARPDPPTRIAAIQQLYGLPRAEAIDRLRLVLGGDPDVRVRQAAAQALVVLGGDDAGAVLQAALGDSDPRVRGLVLTGLSLQGGPEATAVLGQILHADADPTLRARAARLLARDGGPAARALLRDADVP